RLAPREAGGLHGDRRRAHDAAARRQPPRGGGEADGGRSEGARRDLRTGLGVPVRHDPSNAVLVSYRDGIAVVREMLVGKRGDALGRARSFGYAQRSVIDEASIAQVEALHDRTMPFLFDEIGTVDETKVAIAKVEELIAAYDAVLARSAAALVSTVL